MSPKEPPSRTVALLHEQVLFGSVLAFHNRPNQRPPLPFLFIADSGLQVLVEWRMREGAARRGVARAAPPPRAPVTLADDH